MKLTKMCLYPWIFMQVHAGGMMQCCAVGPDTDIGDFILDYCEKKAEDKECDPFNNEGLMAIREGILTGNLRPMCRDCFFVNNNMVTTEELKTKLIEVLQPKYPDINLEQADLRKFYSYKWMAISFTNRCNLSCIYCVQSGLKDTNPYFKMEFPYQYAEMTLDMMAAQGINIISTCVEGEATLYKHWYDLFSRFREKYPEISLIMTTNLNRRFTDQELELLSRYKRLDISLDSLDPKIYADIRRNGNLDLVLENIDLIIAKSKEMGVTQPTITLHSVVCDRTWRSLEDIAAYAFQRGLGIMLGDYEERANSLAVKDKLLKPISQMPIEEQKMAYDVIEKIKKTGEQNGCMVILQGEIYSKIKDNVTENYHKFKPYDKNPIFIALEKKYPKGKETLYLDIEYDDDNISHEGILIGRGEKLQLEGLEDISYVIVREIYIYDENKYAPRYHQKVMLRYRKKVEVEDGKLEIEVSYPNEDVAKVMLEICDYN